MRSMRGRHRSQSVWDPLLATCPQLPSSCFFLKSAGSRLQIEFPRDEAQPAFPSAWQTRGIRAGLSLLLVFMSPSSCPRSGFRTEELGTQGRARMGPRMPWQKALIPRLHRLLRQSQAAPRLHSTALLIVLPLIL